MNLARTQPPRGEAYRTLDALVGAGTLYDGAGTFKQRVAGLVFAREFTLPFGDNPRTALEGKF